jgi:hypothetical protein
MARACFWDINVQALTVAPRTLSKDAQNAQNATSNTMSKTNVAYVFRIASMS